MMAARIRRDRLSPAQRRALFRRALMEADRRAVAADFGLTFQQLETQIQKYAAEYRAVRADLVAKGTAVPSRRARAPWRIFSDEENRLLRRRHAEGRTPAEIAAELGCNEQRVYDRLRYLGLMGTPPRRVRLDQRDCLSCQQPFLSEGPANRICPECKESPEWRSGGDAEGPVLGTGT